MEVLRIKKIDNDISMMELDLEGEKVNKLSKVALMKISETLKQLSSSGLKCLIVISRKPKIFIAGADIEEIKDIKTPEAAKDAASQGQGIINQFEDLPFPVIASINGACMGGGTELALACDYRIASDDPSTKIGLPETKLGILPGFGGCIRLPRVIGIQAALDIILAGKAVDAKKAMKLGLVDEMTPVLMLEEYTIKFAKEIVAKGARKRKKVFSAKGLPGKLLESPIGRPIVFSQAKKMLLSQTKGHYPAPVKALEVVQKTYGMSNRKQALAIEAKAFGEVAATDVSKNLINLFYMMEAVKKQTGVSDSSVKPLKISKMAVLGAGTMGGGIAQLGADKGLEVRMKDINTSAIALGFQQAQKIWSKLVQKRKLTPSEYEQKLARISGGTNFDGFKNTDVVVEAIVEDMNIKKKVLAETYENCKPDVILATNTSSLSVTEMGADLKEPENFVGMHFFNPVHKMPLVEVIRGAKSSDVAVATIFDLCKKMGKTPVVMKDGPGFLVNRLLLPYLNEAVYLLEEGYAAEDIDKAFLKFGMPMGPLHLIDEVGIDVGVKVAKIFHKAFGERAAPSKSMMKIIETGRLGKKNKKGFYLYDDRGYKLNLDPTIYKDLGLPMPTKKLDAKVAIDRCIFAMINEAALAYLEDKIVETPEDVDMSMIMGTGFPPFRGGLLRYADSVGSEKIVDTLEEFAVKFGPRFKPSNPLKQMAKTHRKFYN
ncbi:MAG: 3-hydroxyacyl-CoA dehydrogenase NAD-binding domain-containing protein [Bdellovibrionota bacterium]